MLEMEVRVMNGIWRLKQKVSGGIYDFFIDEEGDTNLISIIVVLVIVMALAVVFRKNIATLVNNIWDSIFKESNAATGASGSKTAFN